MTLATLYRGLFYLFILWVPVPLGSNRPIFWAINGILCLVVFTLLVLDETFGERRRASSRRAILGLLALTAIPLAYMLLQAVPFSPSLLHAAEWDRVRAEGIATAGAISVNPSATYMAACFFVTTALAGIIAARIASQPRRAATLLHVVLIGAGIVAAWGLAALGLDLPQTILGGEGAGAALTSFFVNRNTAATYIGLGLVTAVALLARRLSDSTGSDRVLAVLVDFPRRAGIHLAIVIFFTVALLATASRAGVLAGLFAALVVFAIGTRGAGRSTRIVVGATMLVAAAVLVLLGETSTVFFSRLAALDLDDARWPLYGDTIDAILARPILGYGAGTFADFFPAFHGADLPRDGVWLEAHNTYLETAAELGIPMFVLALGGLVFLAVRSLRAAWRGDDPVPASLAATGAALIVAIHSLLDFSLQVQAVAILFAVLLGAGSAAPARISYRRRDADPPPAPAERRYEGFSVVPERPKVVS
ncbi:MAG: O-antigen ligase family protein [Bauldia sp.]